MEMKKSGTERTGNNMRGSGSPARGTTTNRPAHTHHQVAGDYAQARELLQNKQAADLFPPQRKSLASVCKTDKITHAFKMLIEQGILSVPVYDVSSQSFVGFVDMLDMVAHVVRVLGRDCVRDEVDFDSLLASVERFGAADVAAISDLSRRNPYYPIEDSSPLLTVINLIFRTRVHRLPVVDDEGQLLTVITQSHVVRIIAEHIHLFAPFANKTVGELSLGYKKVTALGPSSPVFDAFVAMHEKGYSAIAVTNEDGQLIGNVSNSDLKVIGYSGKLLNNLLLPISEFMILLPENKTISGPIAVTPDATFEEVVTKLDLCRVHRLYVVEDGRPIGVITGLEIISAVASLFS